MASTRILVVLLFAVFAPIAAQAQGYPCWTDSRVQGDEIISSFCFPRPDSRDHPDSVRVALYTRCRIFKGGRDEYTGNCCDHLTSGLAQSLYVCENDQPIATGYDAWLTLYETENAVGRVCSIGIVDCEELARRYLR